jgi:molybdate transport system regulatory protein
MLAVAKEMGYSYRTILNYVQDIENNLDIKIVKTKKGGIGGGGNTILTSEGLKILKKCKIINAIIELHKGLNEINTVVTDINKDQKSMSIRIGDYDVILPLKNNYEVGDNVLALISYENIFIMLEPQKSTIKNIFKGIITEMQLIDNIFRIKISSGDMGIYSDITKMAADNLNLTLGKEVYIGFKAMAVGLLKESTINKKYEVETEQPEIKTTENTINKNNENKTEQPEIKTTENTINKNNENKTNKPEIKTTENTINKNNENKTNKPEIKTIENTINKNNENKTNKPEIKTTENTINKNNENKTDKPEIKITENTINKNNENKTDKPEIKITENTINKNNENKTNNN